MPTPKPKPKTEPKLTDTERHKRFVAMAKEVDASTKQDDFERAFQAVTKPQPKPKAS